MQLYLERYAAQDAVLAQALSETFDFAVVVPLLGEAKLAWPLFESLSQAAAHSNAHALAVVLVNATDAHPEWAHRANEVTLLTLIEEAEKLNHVRPAWRRRWSQTLTLLVVDRASEAWRLPPRSGVGDARKIGCDIALALYARGLIRHAVLSTTDADARVAPDYFEWPTKQVSAICHPFRHEVEHGESLALLLYEISLRYYVLGLRGAGSPYAFHTIGSTMSFRAEAYAAVRGFPRREAAEDFYLLDKLAKLGGVATGGGQVNLVARPSARVPFGTGRSMQTIDEALAKGEVYRLYDPTCFTALQVWLEAARRFVDHGDSDRTRAEVGAGFEPALTRALDRQKVWEVLATAWRTRKSAADRWRHITTAYDGLKHLQLVHALRDDGYPKLPWREALAKAGYDTSGSELDCLEHLRKLEASFQ